MAMRGRRRGRGPRQGEADPEDAKKDQAGRRKEEDEDDTMDPAEREFDDAMRFGVETVFNPSVTLESLAEFMPATPITPAGRAATALQSLARIGTADPIGAPLVWQARSYAQQVEASGVHLFPDAETRAATEAYLQQKRRDEAAAKAGADGDGSGETAKDGAGGGGDEEPILQPASEAVRQVIMDEAIAGRHEAPRFGSDPAAVAHAWLLRSETYSPGDRDKFEAKLQSLLSRAGKAGAARPKAGAA